MKITSVRPINHKLQHSQTLMMPQHNPISLLLRITLVNKN